jgi:FAD:protein FMN transferase
MSTVSAEVEAIDAAAVFGGRAIVAVLGDGAAGEPAAAAAAAIRRLTAWHEQFSRFEPGSELSRLNGDPRSSVPVSAVMYRLIEAILDGALISGGLVDATLVGEIERAGYAAAREAGELDLRAALDLAPAPRPAAPNPRAHWDQVSLDRRNSTVTRPPGLRFDSGGIAKGLFADILAEVLGTHTAFAIDCAGDVRVGGAGGLARPVNVASPFDAGVLHTFELRDGAAATSGITRRAWLDAQGRPAHHLLDPASGRPAYTGIVQATALAPTAVEAEIHAKTALLRGPSGASSAIPHGGLLVYADGSYELI